MLKCPFKVLNKRDWILYIVSLVIVICSNFFTENIDYFKMASTIIGATALIFVAKGNVWGQILSVAFCVMYAYTSYLFRYYGEMITYLAMSLPIAVVSVFTWIRNPYKKGQPVVKIHRLLKKEIVFMVVLAISVTVGFYFVLKALETPNLIISTVSVTTSFFAAYLLMRRNSYYALAYALNDLVLITLWVLACIEDIGYLTVVSCFVMFFINDLYGFISWKIREREQGLI
ncbi:MAG: nicotinamide mononucleotide transporter [Clostridia bacterium]|nr:nicotinamide mononucleotide transporter [Clostridia bacterium]